MTGRESVAFPDDADTPLREAWLLRADKIVSKVMLHRYARLYEDKLQIFHIKEKESPELEHVLPLRGCSLRDVQTCEADVKPRGSNLFIGYVSGDIKARTVVRLFAFASCSMPGTRAHEVWWAAVRHVSHLPMQIRSSSCSVSPGQLVTVSRLASKCPC